MGQSQRLPIEEIYTAAVPTTEFPELSRAAGTHFHSPKSLFQGPAEGIAMRYHPPLAPKL